MRKLIILAALAALAVPAAAFAEDTAPAATTTPTANETCKLELGQLGLATFRLTHGTLPNRANAFGKCVSKLTAAVADAARNAAKQCKAEQGDATFATTHDGKTFAQVYGGDEKARNAFGKCVSAKARADLTEQVDAVANAAKACKTERAGDAAAFRSKYGTGPNKANAFGKCVSKTVQQAATTA